LREAFDSGQRFRLLRADVLDYSKVNAGHLNFKKLNFRSSSLNLNLDFQTGQFDKMLCSIVLSYLFNPLESLLEFERILKPGGRLVISTFRPDVDMSRIYTRLIQKIESDPYYVAPNGMACEEFLNAVRAFANSAAFLLQLEEDGSFKFFSLEELRTSWKRLVSRTFSFPTPLASLIKPTWPSARSIEVRSPKLRSFKQEVSKVDGQTPH
jgi:SAM-dependent methyltransferase